MRRGEVWLVDFDPAIGSEVSKRRPAVIVSNDHLNGTSERLRRGIVTVVPLSSNTAHVWDFQVLMPASETGLDRDSKAQAEQVRVVDVRRLRHRVGTLPPSLVWQLDEALLLHLGLN